MGQHQVCRTPFLRAVCGEGWGRVGVGRGGRILQTVLILVAWNMESEVAQSGYGGGGVAETCLGAPPLGNTHISVYAVLNVAAS